MDREIWKSLEGFDFDYQVSNFGNVKNNDSGNILTPSPTKKNYLRVCLKYQGKHKTFKVHRLVAQAFIPNPNNYNEINHINRNRADNRVENLEWTTHVKNMLGAYKKGKRNIRYKGTGVALYINGKKIKEYKSISLASEETKISSHVIRYLINPKNKHITWKKITPPSK